MNSKQVLVITSKGLGDGLMMMIASERLRRHGYIVTTMNDHLGGLASWFPNHEFVKESNPAEQVTFFSKFDLVLLQNDNTEKSRAIIKLHKLGKIRSLSIFYSSYEPSKHPPLTFWDIVFDSKKTMVENISKGIAFLLRSKEISTNNGIIPPSFLNFRRFQRRVLIHPTASTQDRMWPFNSFLQIGKILKENDYDPIMSLSKREREYFSMEELKQIYSPKIESLSDLAALIFESGYVIGNESGIVHLASNLHIPTIVISGHEKRIQMWRPGWLQGLVVTPPKWIPNWKFLRLREKRWKTLISPQQVYRNFMRQVTIT